MSKIYNSQVLITFFKHIQFTETCWIWDTQQKHGYGQLRAFGKLYRAHRFSYELHFGPIPEGLFVCHKCDNPPCVNPDHLFLGTAKDNIQDMIAKGRRPDISGDKNGMRKHPEKVVVKRGDEHWTRIHPENLATGDKSGRRLHPESYIRCKNKLSLKQEAEILDLWKKEQLTRSELAYKFNVSKSTIDRVIARTKNLFLGYDIEQVGKETRRLLGV